MKVVYLLLSAQVLMAFLGLLARTEDPDKIQVHKFSFRMPWGATNYQYWEARGNVVTANDVIRLTGNSPSQKGSIWAKEPLNLRNWEADFSIIVGKDGAGLGADGMAFWVTKDRAVSGNMFGSKNPWEGLGVIFDSFDNDNQKDNPAIYAVFNRGDREYPTSSDGLGGGAVGMCKIDFRTKTHNTQKDGFHVRIRYEHGRLSVLTDTMAMYNLAGEQWHECLSAEIAIPYGYYIGLTAETGGLSDYHEIEYFNFYDLGGPEVKVPDPLPTQRQIPFPNPKFPNANLNRKPESMPSPQSASQEPRQADPQEPPQKSASLDISNEDIAKLSSFFVNLQTKIDSLISRQVTQENSLNFRLSALERVSQDIYQQAEASKTSAINMNERVEALATSFSQTEAKLIQSSNQVLNSIQGGGSQAEIKRDLTNLQNTISQLQSLIHSIQQGVSKTETVASQLKAGHEEKSQKLAQLVQESSSWGFWTFFIIFQVLFLFVFFYWKKTRDEKHKAHFY